MNKEIRETLRNLKTYAKVMQHSYVLHNVMKLEKQLKQQRNETKN